MGDNYREVDLTANALINVGAIHELSESNISTYSVNSNSTTLYEFESDTIGNITNVSGVDINWNGRRLESISQNGTVVVSYDYNIDGQRTKKTALDTETGEYITTEFFYNGDILAGQKTGNDTIIFMYDNNGDIFGFEYNGTPYYYVKNAQNDVVMVLNCNDRTSVVYQYDAWGNITDVYDSTTQRVSNINPITYRSYYYDIEMGVYYLNSRYYVPIICRFLSADGYVQTGQGVLDKNMFAYCLNNPVNRIDANGENSDAVKLWATTMSWLCFIDSLLPIGDMVYWGGIALLAVGGAIAAGEFASSSTVSVPKVEEKEKVITKTKIKDSDPRRHHMVPQGATKSEKARQVLLGVGIEPKNSPLNIVVISQGLHKSIHTNNYYNYIDSKILPCEGDRVAVEQALAEIRADILFAEATGVRKWEIT